MILSIHLVPTNNPLLFFHNSLALPSILRINKIIKMTGSQTFQASIDGELKDPIVATPRNVSNTHKINLMNSEIGDDTLLKKKHTNNKSIVIGIVGCTIIGFIIYSLVANYTALLQ